MKPELVLGESEFDELMAQHLPNSDPLPGTSGSENDPIDITIIPSTSTGTNHNNHGAKASPRSKGVSDGRVGKRTKKKRRGLPKPAIVVTPKEEVSDENCELTTFRMLVNTTEITSNAEFVDCCQEAKILSSSRACPSCPGKPSLAILQVPYGIDECIWKCEACDIELPVRQGSWLEDCSDLKLKDIVLSLYGWARGWTKEITKLETSIEDLKTIERIYEKCDKLTDHFFVNELCNIGGSHTEVSVDLFHTRSGLTIVSGVEKEPPHNFFFRIMPDNYTRDDVVTAFIDNIYGGTNVFCGRGVLSTVTKEGVKYMLKNWGLNLRLWKKPANIHWKQMWWLYMKSVMLDNVRSTLHLHEYLFRRRMNSHRDSFLYLIFVIGTLYPPPT